MSAIATPSPTRTLLAVFKRELGGYFATIGGFKAKWVAERMRATVYNIYRVPLSARPRGGPMGGPAPPAPRPPDR